MSPGDVVCITLQGLIYSHCLRKVGTYGHFNFTYILITYIHFICLLFVVF